MVDYYAIIKIRLIKNNCTLAGYEEITVKTPSHFTKKKAHNSKRLCIHRACLLIFKCQVLNPFELGVGSASDWNSTDPSL